MILHLVCPLAISSGAEFYATDRFARPTPKKTKMHFRHQPSHMRKIYEG